MVSWLQILPLQKKLFSIGKMFKEYKDFDATGLANLIEKKEISPKELLDEAIFQTEEKYLIMNFKNQIKETSEY